MKKPARKGRLQGGGGSEDYFSGSILREGDIAVHRGDADIGTAAVERAADDLAAGHWRERRHRCQRSKRGGAIGAGFASRLGAFTGGLGGFAHRDGGLAGGFGADLDGFADGGADYLRLVEISLAPLALEVFRLMVTLRRPAFGV